MRTGDLVRIRGERWRILRCVAYSAAAIIDAEGCGGVNTGERARFLLPGEPLDRLPSSDVPRVVRPAQWRHAARRALADACPPWTSLRAATRANLMLLPFQLEPALALVRGDGCRFLIADGVGMGKTIQAALLIAETAQRRAEGRALIVAPAGLRDQWRDELRDRFGLDADILDAARIARTSALLPAGLNPWSVHAIVISSIDYVKRPEVLRSLEALVWDVVVFDEAHGLAGRSDRAAAAAALGGRARTLVLLTATPHAGDDEAFRRMCRIGNVDGAPLLWFRRTQAHIGTSRARRTVLLRVRPSAAEAAMHHALLQYGRLIWSQSDSGIASGARLAVSVLLRRACSSAASLARSVQRRMTLLEAGSEAPRVQPSLPFAELAGEDDEPAVVLGAAGLPDATEEHAWLERIQRLAHEAARAESKLMALRRLLARSHEPALIFTEYRDTLQRVASALRNIDAAHLHGGLGAADRLEALRRFTNGGARLLLATDAASEGLNLHQRCRLVINLELPWTPLRLEQRAGRVDRIGQTRRVHVVHMVAAGTSEEEVLARLAARAGRADRALLAAGSWRVQDVAACVFDGRDLPEHDTPAAATPEIVAPDLARQASAEAERIAAARALITPCNATAGGGRAPLTFIRRRRSRGRQPRCYWMFRLLYATNDGKVVWESMLPLSGTPLAPSSPSSLWTRALLNPLHPAVQHAVAAAKEQQLDMLRGELRRPVQLWIARERALVDALRRRHGRLATNLLQLGLFDRRDERTAAAQAALLDEALSQSIARAAALGAHHEVRVQSCELVFAVAVG